MQLRDWLQCMFNVSSGKGYTNTTANLLARCGCHGAGDREDAEANPAASGTRLWPASGTGAGTHHHQQLPQVQPAVNHTKEKVFAIEGNCHSSHHEKEILGNFAGLPKSPKDNWQWKACSGRDRPKRRRSFVFIKWSRYIRALCYRDELLEQTQVSRRYEARAKDLKTLLESSNDKLQVRSRNHRCV